MGCQAVRIMGLAAVAAALSGCGGDGDGVGGVSPAPGSFTPEPAFTTLAFDRVTDLQARVNASGEEWLFVVEKGGTIRRFDPDAASPSPTTFLDIRGLADFGDEGEGGLLGLAFDPAYASNGHFYVHYTRQRDLGTASEVNEIVISRFTSTGSGGAATSTEEVVLTVDHPGQTNHYAGALAFGPVDGYLYLTMGDGGGAFDPAGNAQDRGTLLGSILRIDVSTTGTGGTPNYSIPSGNPFVGNTEGHREEIFARGLRNPYRLSIDQPTMSTQRVWVADVGQNRREEVNVLDPSGGGNYGWDCREGTLEVDEDQQAAECAGLPDAAFTPPVDEYGHDLGNSITGGYVYRGSRFPSLQGRYVFGDFISGRVWAYSLDDDSRIELADTELMISTFGRRADGELLMADFGPDGGLYRLTR